MERWKAEVWIDCTISCQNAIKNNAFTCGPIYYHINRCILIVNGYTTESRYSIDYTRHIIEI